MNFPRLTVAVAVLASTAIVPVHAAGAELLAGFKDIPALPLKSKGADCGAATRAAERMEQQMQSESLALTSSGVPPPAPAALTDAQAKAMQGLNDPNYNQCMMNFTMTAETRFQPVIEKLSAKLNTLEQAKSKHDEDFCATHPAEACIGDPDSARQFNVQAAAAGDAFLSEVKPAFESFRKEALDCASLRENVSGAIAKAGAPAMLQYQLQSARLLSWALPVRVATAQASLCGAAVEAGSKFQN